MSLCLKKIERHLDSADLHESNLQNAKTVLVCSVALTWTLRLRLRDSFTTFTVVIFYECERKEALHSRKQLHKILKCSLSEFYPEAETNSDCNVVYL